MRGETGACGDLCRRVGHPSMWSLHSTGVLTLPHVARAWHLERMLVGIEDGSHHYPRPGTSCEDENKTLITQKVKMSKNSLLFDESETKG